MQESTAMHLKLVSAYMNNHQYYFEEDGESKLLVGDEPLDIKKTNVNMLIDNLFSAQNKDIAME